MMFVIRKHRGHLTLNPFPLFHRSDQCNVLHEYGN